MTDRWAQPRDELLALPTEAFAVTWIVPTRWRDNDQYGHINNALYYEYFDTAINTWIDRALPASSARDTTRMYVAESACRYLAGASFPSSLVVGLNVARLGSTSVIYELAVFSYRPDKDSTISAIGRWVHVFVDAVSGRPVPIPDDVRALLAATVQAQEASV